MKCAFVYYSSTGITPKYAYEIAKGITSKEICTFDFIIEQIVEAKGFNIGGFNELSGQLGYSWLLSIFTLFITSTILFKKKRKKIN